MNSSVIIQNIARYLDAKTLLELSKLNKLFRKVVFLDSFWEPLLYNEFSSTLDIFGEIITSKDQIKPLIIPVTYFSLYKYATIKFNSILLLSGEYLYKEDLLQIFVEFTENLKNPMPSIPCLRREGKNFQTVVQDILGNAFNEQLGNFSLPSQSELIIQNLFNNEENIKNEFCSDKDLTDLIRTRWIIKKKYSKGRENSKKKSIFLCKMAKVLRNCFKAHCKIVKKKLSGLSNVHELLSEYCVQWEAYSANISVFESIFSPFCIIINELYDSVKPTKTKTPPYTILRLMIITWRQEIFDWVYKDLINGALHIISKIRTSLKDPKKSDLTQYETDITLISRIVNFIVDFSGNELSFQFIEHTKFNCEDCYLILEQKIERLTQQYYDDISKCPLNVAKALLKNDNLLICRVFLNRTQAIIRKIMLEVLLVSYQNFYFPLYKDYSQFSIDDLPPEPAMYTAFGKMLFTNDSNQNTTKRIRNFFEYMKVKNIIGDVNEYNDIVFFKQDAKLDEIKKGVNSKDLEIEYINEGVGVSLEVSDVERKFFSVFKDITFEAVEQL